MYLLVILSASLAGCGIPLSEARHVEEARMHLDEIADVRETAANWLGLYGDGLATRREAVAGLAEAREQSERLVTRIDRMQVPGNYTTAHEFLLLAAQNLDLALLAAGLCIETLDHDLCADARVYTSRSSVALGFARLHYYGQDPEQPAPPELPIPEPTPEAPSAGALPHEPKNVGVEVNYSLLNWETTYASTFLRAGSCAEPFFGYRMSDALRPGGHVEGLVESVGQAEGTWVRTTLAVEVEVDGGPRTCHDLVFDAGANVHLDLMLTNGTLFARCSGCGATLWDYAEPPEVDLTPYRLSVTVTNRDMAPGRYAGIHSVACSLDESAGDQRISVCPSLIARGSLAANESVTLNHTFVPTPLGASLNERYVDWENMTLDATAQYYEHRGQPRGTFRLEAATRDVAVEIDVWPNRISVVCTGCEVRRE